MDQTKYDEAYMQMAEAAASLSQDPDTQVGCVIVKDNYVLASGFNGTPRGCDNTCKHHTGVTKSEVIHAEMNALMQMARSTQSTVGATAYTTLQPCLPSAIHMYQAGITRVVFRDSTDNDAGKLLLMKGLGNGNISSLPKGKGSDQ